MLFQLMDVNLHDHNSSLVGYCSTDRTEKLWEYIHSEPFLQKLPGDVMFSWGSKQEERGLPLYTLKKPGKSHAGPDGSDIEQVEVVSDSQSGPYSLLISFSGAGAEKWAVLTGSNIGYDIAIVINDRVWSAPRVQDQIKMGKCMITGNFSKSEASALREQLDTNP
jgi:SecD/SecF fusion protein